MRFGILKTALLTISLSLSACKTLEDPPPHYLCQWNGSPRAFYCVHSVTKERLKLAADSPIMKAAQCLKADDYENMMAYIDYLIGQAERRCK